MSAVSESMNRRMTLGLLASRYGFDLDPTSAAEVTITSIADDVESVRPGALFVPSADVATKPTERTTGTAATTTIPSISDMK
ncbi:UDP-N-acetylmuramyl peptide synthase, partial [Bifidobacterium adolescentis]|nr:UDP-N-acetylmuramyl peptide synthase [Bifidobacterium adolescentis]